MQVAQNHVIKINAPSCCCPCRTVILTAISIKSSQQSYDGKCLSTMPMHAGLGESCTCEDLRYCHEGFGFGGSKEVDSAVKSGD